MQSEKKPMPGYRNSATQYGHRHGEAFMLMRYRCEKCGKQEMIWNSRDGVTPFAVSCSVCPGMMQHVDFGGDIYSPDYKPGVGHRYFRDGTPDEAADIMRRRLDRMRDQYPTTPEYERELIEGARNAHATGGQNFHEFQKGWPMLDAWTEPPDAD